MDAEVRSIDIGVFVTACILVTPSVVLLIGFLIFNLRYRNERVIKMSSPNLNTLISVGCLLLYITCIMYTSEALATEYNITLITKSCQTRIWLLSLGFSLTFGAMLAKAWRVRKIFMNGSLQRVVIRDNLLLGIVLVILIIDIVILSLWQSLDTVAVNIVKGSVHVNNEGTFPEGKNTLQCSSKYSSIFGSILFCYKAIILVTSTYLAWSIKGITLPTMNDSTCIIFSSVFTAITGSIATTISIVLNDWPTASSSVIVLTLWLTTTLIQCLVYIPKIHVWWNNHEDFMKMTMTSQMIYSPSQSLAQIEEEMYHLLTENRSLKKSLSEKEATIKNLQQHVATAKDNLVKLMTEDARHDSGLELSSNSSQECGQKPQDSNTTKGHQKGHIKKSSSLSEADISKLKCVEEDVGANQHPPCYAKAVTRWSSLPQSKHKPKERSESFKVATQKESINDVVKQLNAVDDMSLSLRQSITHDLQQYNTGVTQRDNYCPVHGQKGLTNSIVESFQLEDDSDTFSYISSCVGSYGFNEYASDKETNPRASVCSSCDSVYTLENDCYYPSLQMPHRKPRKRRSRSRSKRWKQPPVTKIYTLQQPREPTIATAGIAKTKTLHHATFV